MPDSSIDASLSQAKGVETELQITGLRLYIDAQARKLQEKYNNDYDTRVRDTPVIKPNDYFLVKNPPLRSTPGNNTEALSKQACSKLQPQTTGHFKVITLQDMTLTTDERGTPQKILIDHVIHASNASNRNPSEFHEKTASKSSFAIAVYSERHLSEPRARSR